MDGDTLSQAQYLVAAVQFHLPHLRSPKLMMLPTARQTLQGWRKLDPPMSRLPFPHEVVCLMSEFAGKEGQAGGVLDDAAGNGVLPSTGGVGEVESHGPGPSGQGDSCEQSPLVTGVAPVGGRSRLEGSGVRRNNHPRSSRAKGGGRDYLPCSAAAFSSSNRAPLHGRHRQPHKGNDSGGQQVQHDVFGAPSRLQVEAHRCQQGFCQAPSDHGRHPTARPLEECTVSQAVPEGWTPPANAQDVVKRCQKKVCRPRYRRQKQEQACSGPCAQHRPANVWKSFSGDFFLAAVILGKSIARITAWAVLLWDISLGPQYDLRDARNRFRMGEWIRCGFVLGLHLGTPCESFTRARDVRPGPPPLRSNEQPLGLPNLRPGDQLKVLTGNLFLRFSVWILQLPLQFRVWATLENPQRSRIWLCPPMLALMRRPRVSLYTTHYCFWGKPFKQATSFLAVNMVLKRLISAQCHASKRRSHTSPMCSSMAKTQLGSG